MSLEQLNSLRVGAGKTPLKSWKESKAKLAAAIALYTIAKTVDKLAVAVAVAPSTNDRDAAVQKRKEQMAAGKFADDSKPDPVAEFVAKNGVTKCPPPAEIEAQRKRREQIDKIADKRVKGDTTAKLPKPQQRGPNPAGYDAAMKSKSPAKSKLSGDGLKLADIAREIGVDPKVARAKMRRVDVPAGYSTGKHVFKPEHRKWVVEQLSKGSK